MNGGLRDDMQGESEIHRGYRRDKMATREYGDNQKTT